MQAWNIIRHLRRKWDLWLNDNTNNKIFSFTFGRRKYMWNLINFLVQNSVEIQKVLCKWAVQGFPNLLFLEFSVFATLNIKF